MPKYNFIDLTGQRFGELKVIGVGEKRGTARSAFWVCECSCGNRVTVNGTLLRSGKKTHCGCMNKKMTDEDLTGQKFGKLTVIDKDPDGFITSQGKKTVGWRCKCKCGNIKTIIPAVLKSGATKSCGQCSIYSYYSKSPIMRLTADNMYGQIKETEQGYEVYFLGDYIGTYKTYKSAWAVRRLCEEVIISLPRDEYIAKMQEYHNKLAKDKKNIP